MNAASTHESQSAVAREASQPSPGYWSETWRRFRRRKLSMLALAYVVGLALVAILAPCIAGTKPIVCRYKGQLYFPALGYINPNWENPIFYKDRFRRVYPKTLKEKDPESWAIWPLKYQDPHRRVRDDEWPAAPKTAEDESAEPAAPDSVEEGSRPKVGIPPNRTHWCGADGEDKDVFAQLVHGTRTAMLVGFVSMGLAALIGITLGASAGYFGGWVDILLSRLIELVMCIPTLVLILALLAVLKRPTIWHLMAIIGATGWTGIARLTRAEFLKLKAMDYVAAARALGASAPRIMFLHILRNALAPIFAPITFGIASAIIVESALSYLGFGAPPPNPSWGTLLNAGRTTIEDTWWLIFFPGLAIFLTVMAYNLIGEGLQEATDPRLREAGK